jgi:peptide/nickel transport system permease protein
MIAYVIRRLLLMIPTLIGITFLVFMLIALSPGGIGAAISFAGGGGEGGQNRAIQEAYLEDRYGLDDPVIVQYVRWLGRISPLKFGRPDQRDPAGSIIRPPKALDPPDLARELFAEIDDVPTPPEPEPFELPTLDDLPEPTAEEEALDRTDAERLAAAADALYRSAANRYTNVRAEFIAARADLELAIAQYLTAVEGIEEPRDDDQDLIPEYIEGLTIDTSTPEGEAALAQARRVIETFDAATQARARLAGIWSAGPYPDVRYSIPLFVGDAAIPLRIGNLVHLAPPDFGESFSRQRPVLDLILEALPVTLMLNLIAIPVIYLIAVPSGILAAVRRGSLFDTLSGALLVALWSIPVVWAGVLFQGFLANEQYLGWFPVATLSTPGSEDWTFLPAGNFFTDWSQRGYLIDTLWHVVLPVTCLVYAGFAILSKQTRAAMLDNFNADYVRTAKAKGVAPNDVVFRHVFRNSLLPIITLFATVFPAMLAGSVVVESIFSIPGMGSLVLEAINLRDREVILANTLMIGGVNLLGLLLADILYALADPRITYS